MKSYNQSFVYHIYTSIVLIATLSTAYTYSMNPPAPAAPAAPTGQPDALAPVMQNVSALLQAGGRFLKDGAEAGSKIVTDTVEAIGKQRERALQKAAAESARKRQIITDEKLALILEKDKDERDLVKCQGRLAKAREWDKPELEAERARLEDKIAVSKHNISQKDEELNKEKLEADAANKRIAEQFQKAGDTFLDVVKGGASALMPDVNKMNQAEKVKEGIITAAHLAITRYSDPKRLALMTAAIIGVFYTLKFSYQALEDWYQVPELADKTTLVGPLTKLWRFINDTEVFNTTLDDVVLDPELTEEFRNYVESTKNIIENGGHLRPLLLPGPPGTGKTTLGFALAGELGIDAIYFNVGNLKNCSLETSLRRLDQLFKNAENGSRPILIIGDEIELIMKHRDDQKTSEETKMLQNKLMGRLGTPQNDFIFVGLTNRIQDFDPAFINRFQGRIIEILPPALEQRKQMIEMYITKHLLNPSCKAKSSWFDKLFSDIEPLVPTIDEDVFTPERKNALAEQIVGFSGRDINNLFTDVYQAALATPDLHITKAMFDKTVDKFIKGVEKYAKPQITAPAA